MRKIDVEIKAFLERLGLREITEVRKFRNGNVNQTYRIASSSGIFVFRLFKHLNKKEIESNLKLLQSLRSLSVPAPVSFVGKTIFKFQNKWCVIFRYLSGDTKSVLNSKHLRQVGDFLGKFHLVGKKSKWIGPKNKFYDFTHSKIKKIQKYAKTNKVPYTNLLPKIVEELKANTLSNRLEVWPIHVDIKPENVLFEKGKLSGVIDFDNAYRGPLILDLAKSMVWFGIKNKKFDLVRALEVLKGYQKIRPLSVLERKELHKAVKFAFLSHIFMDYHMYAAGKTSKVYFEFIVKNFYACFKSFTLSKPEFDMLILKSGL